MTGIRNLLLLGAMVYCLALTSLAQQETGNCGKENGARRPDCEQAIRFFRQMQSAVKLDQQDKIASMTNFPLRTSLNGKRTLIRSKQQFLNDYSQIFNDAVRCAIDAAVESDVWGNYQGFMVGRGVIWWDRIIPSSEPHPEQNRAKYPFKIITVNNGDALVPGCAHK